MIPIVLAILLALTSCQTDDKVSDAQKNAFIELLKTLPHKGEFYTEEAIEKAKPYLPVLFSLTEKDIDGHDIYPFLAVSRGLCDRKEQRDYAAFHFAEIRHPILKLGWGVMLFDANAASPEIVRFLREALESEKQAKLLSEMLGPGFEKFQQQIKSYPDAKKADST